MMIKTCPTCGKKAIREATEDIKFPSGRIARAVPHLKCDECGERLFDRESHQVMDPQLVAQRARGRHKKAS